MTTAAAENFFIEMYSPESNVLMFFPISRESHWVIDWQQEMADLKQEVCNLQEELAEGRAERQELEARCKALQERVRSVRWS